MLLRRIGLAWAPRHARRCTRLGDRPVTLAARWAFRSRTRSFCAVVGGGKFDRLASLGARGSEGYGFGGVCRPCHRQVLLSSTSGLAVAVRVMPRKPDRRSESLGPVVAKTWAVPEVWSLAFACRSSPRYEREMREELWGQETPRQQMARDGEGKSEGMVMREDTK